MTTLEGKNYHPLQKIKSTSRKKFSDFFFKNNFNTIFFRKISILILYPRNIKQFPTREFIINSEEKNFFRWKKKANSTAKNGGNDSGKKGEINKILLTISNI